MGEAGLKLALSLLVVALLLTIFYWLNFAGNSTYNAILYERGQPLFFKNGKPDSPGMPYVVKARIAHEASNQVVFDVQYHMPLENPHKYALYFSPDVADCQHQYEILKPGTNMVRLVVMYLPDSFFKRNRKSKIVDISIRRAIGVPTRNKDDALQGFDGIVFHKKVAFEKTWTRPPAQFWRLNDAELKVRYR